MTEKRDFLFEIAGIGNACVDFVADCDLDFLTRHTAEKSHCVYLDKDAVEKVKAELVAPELIPGGAAANTIYAFQALGGKAAFLGKIAKDLEGRLFERSMMDIGIETRLAIDTDPQAGSTQVICLRTPDGDRSFVTYQGVAENIHPDDIDFDVVEKSAIVYFDGYTMYSPFAEDIFLQAANIAKKTDGISVFNPGDLSIVEKYPSQIARLMDAVDMVICNLTEAGAIFHLETLKDAARIIPGKHRLGVVTDGANGAILFKDGEVVHMPPPAPLSQPIYTLGAGDHFSAGFLFGLTKGLPLAKMAELAEACALDCLSHPGARPLGSLVPLYQRVIDRTR